MIQRIQTIYLLIATIVTIIVVCMPLGEIDNVNFELTYSPFFVRLNVPEPGNSIICSTSYIGFSLILFALISFVSIFFYKNRKRQAALISINMIVLLISLILIVYVYPEVIFAKKGILQNGDVLQYNYWFLIIIISAISLYLAKRNILKDEARVRAADRLR